MGMIKDADAWLSKLLYGESMNPESSNLAQKMGWVPNDYAALASPESNRIKMRWAAPDPYARFPLNKWDENPWSAYEGDNRHAPDNAWAVLEYLRNSDDPRMRKAYDFYTNYGRQGP